MKCAVVFGGKSFEHEISIVSAIALKDVLKMDIVYIFCDANRDFYLIPTDIIKSKLFSSGEYKKMNLLSLKQGGFFQKALLGEKKIDFDFVLNLIHGADGEDGKIASLMEFFGVDYVGPRLEASALSFNKLLTKLYASELGVKSVEYELLQKGDYEIKGDFPVIIKPLRLGSSIGVSIVKEQSELEYALDVAYEFDSQVLVEPFIEGVKEYNLAGCKAGEFIFSMVEEPKKEEFLDFDKKYLDFSRTQRVNRADISDELEEKLKSAFEKIYTNMFEGSMIRCDFFVIDDEIYLNEINPVPGSMGNYLYEDFESSLKKLAQNLPKSIEIPIEYNYIHSIQKAKGK